MQRQLDSRELFGLTVSIALHAALVMVLMILFLASPPDPGGGFDLIATNSRLEELSDGNILEATISSLDISTSHDLIETDLTDDDLDWQLYEQLSMEGQIGELEATREEAWQAGEGLPAVRGFQGRGGAFVPGGGVGGRTGGNRQRLQRIGETSRASEEAVEAALAWVAAQQSKDGGWNFSFELNDSLSSGTGLCRNSGTHGSRVAATSISILAFLGAGYTPERGKGGKYWRHLDRGVAWLLKHGVENRLDGSIDFRDGAQGMYSQAIAVLALSEAAAMTTDAKIKAHLQGRAQGGVNFIIKAQDLQHTGGWRYTVKETPGDTSVTGWQLMALKSAREAGLRVPKPTLYRASDFLDLVQYDEGQQYRYTLESELRTGYGRGPDSSKTCTALGNLCRLYLGWVPGEPTLDGGVALLKAWGPLLGRRECNIYYAYVATLVLHHHDGNGWREWFTEVRDHLVATQSKEGHESGSWYVPDYYSDAGGRLYNTALAVMILEVPYRYLPLYREQREELPTEVPLLSSD